MTDDQDDVPTEEHMGTSNPPHMGPEELWNHAKKHHEAMAAEIEHAGDMIGVCAIMFTNMLIGGVMAGVDEGFVDHMLSLVRQDVFNGVHTLGLSMDTMQ